MTDRTAAVTRETAETDIEVVLAVDGDGDATVGDRRAETPSTKGAL